MKFIEIDLDGTVVRARLNEEGAPKTTQAVWDALPFGGKAVHAQISGEMFRMLDHAPVGELEVEARVSHQYPGMMVFLPQIEEIAFCVEQARFSGGVIPSTLTHLGDIEADFSAFMRKGDTLDRTGAKPIQFRRAADQTTPFRHRTYEGRKLDVTFDGVTVGATLLEKMSPKTTSAFGKLLPLEGDATNDTWGGQITRFWGAGPGGALAVAAGETEAPRHLIWPGFAYFDPVRRHLKIAYGESDFKDVSGPIPVTPVFAIDGADLPKYAAKAKLQLTEGAKRLSIKLRG